jgi:gas vesicle protein
MEAMASGRPVVAADAMALPHLVHDGDNGYLFPPDDVVAFADRLRRVLTADEAELKRLSSNSLHLIQAHDIQRTISIFEGLYRGDKDGERTTQDNEDDYLRSIGRLTDVLQERVDALRATAISMRERASERGGEVREEVRERIEEVREKLDEVRDEVKERANEVKKKVKKSVKRASERLKSDD